VTETIVLFYAEGGAVITGAMHFGPTEPTGRQVPLDAVAKMAVGASVLGILRGEDVTTWRIALPHLPTAKLLQILPSQMEDRIALAGANTHFAVLEADKGDGALVAAVAADTMTAALDTAETLGVSLKMLVPDYMLVESAEDIQTLADHNDPQRWLVRYLDGTGFAAEKVIATEISPHISASGTLIFNADMFDALATFNLMQGQFQPRFKAAAYLLLMRRSAVLLGLVFSLWAIASYFEASQTNEEALRIEAQTTDVFQKTFTNVGRIVDMEAQAEREVALRRQNSGGTFLRISEMLFLSVQNTSGVIVDGLRFNEAQNAYLVTVSFTDFANGEQFRNDLVGKGLKVIEGSSRQEGGRVITDLAVEVAS
jgi:type II secretory pathway component PulL